MVCDAVEASAMPVAVAVTVLVMPDSAAMGAAVFAVAL